MRYEQLYGNRLRIFLLNAFVILSLLFVLGVACSPPQVPSEPPAPPVPASQTPPVSSEPTSVAWAADGLISPNEYNHVNSYGDYELNWSSDEKYIYIGLKVKTSGWVAFGIQPGSLMKDADTVLCSVDDDKAVVYDQFSTGDFGPHTPDTELGGTDDILEFDGKEAGGYTVIEFKRALDTGDKYDRPLTNGVNKVIWAYGSDDQPRVKHVTRGYGELDL